MGREAQTKIAVTGPVDMTRTATATIIRQIESLYDGGSIAGLSDGQLLERFDARRDSAGEAAFAALVARHGPMVLHVCRQILGDRHLAEDAFQAVFLVLAQKAHALREPNLVGTWLYGVAIRTARKARARLARLRRGEESESMNRPALDSEVLVDAAIPGLRIQPSPASRLRRCTTRSTAFRRRSSLPVMLCYFEGLTLAEAARRLRMAGRHGAQPLGPGARQARCGLLRRGVALPAGAIAAALGSRSATSVRRVPALRCDHPGGGRASRPETPSRPLAAALAQEVLKSMLVNKLKLAALCVLLSGSLAAGAVCWNHRTARRQSPKIAPAIERTLTRGAARTTGSSPPDG